MVRTVPTPLRPTASLYSPILCPLKHVRAGRLRDCSGISGIYRTSQGSRGSQDRRFVHLLFVRFACMRADTGTRGCASASTPSPGALLSTVQSIPSRPLGGDDALPHICSGWSVEAIHHPLISLTEVVEIGGREEEVVGRWLSWNVQLYVSLIGRGQRDPSSEQSA